MQDVWQDLRYALRLLGKSPGFTAAAVLTLAIGIGANTAIFSVLNRILFEAVPYPHASRVMMIWDIFEGARSEVTFHTFREISSRSHSFETTAVLEPWRPTLSGATEPERLEGQSVSANYFRTLGITPSLGRDFQSPDEAFHGPKVVILSDSLWRRRFRSDHAIVGRGVTLDGDNYEVIGVLPAAFENVLAPPADLWSPMQYDPTHTSDLDTAEWGHHLRMIARLRPGLAPKNAARELNSIAASPRPDFPRAPWAALKSGFIVNPLQQELTRDVRPALLAVFAAVLLVLAIVCVNVTNLLLARGHQRRAEFTMRAVLGAPQRRMVRQLLTESLLLSGLGGILGLFVAQAGIQALLALAPPDLPRLNAILMDRRALLFGMGISAAVGLAVGLIPALYAARRDLQPGLQPGSQRATGGHHSTRRVLVVAEVALAFVLLASTGLLLRSLERLFVVDPGFQPARVLSLLVQTSGHRFDDETARRQFFSRALNQTLQVPGVSSAAFTGLLPLSEKRETVTAGTYGTLFEKDQRSYDVFLYTVTPDYFKAMGIPLRRGRLLTEHDLARSAPAVLVGESLARREFPGGDSLGQRVHVGPTDRPWYTVVGVVGDVRQTSLAVADLDAVYMTADQKWFADDAMSLVVRGGNDVAALLPALRTAIWSVDKDQAILHVATMDALVAQSAAERKFVLVLFEAFGLAALVLAAVGIYGVLSASVTERFREIGIRSALGATRTNLLALILRQGMLLAAVGSIVGLFGAILTSRALRSLLFGVSRLDRFTYFSVMALLLFVSALACWAPARRATKVDPNVALRYE